MPVRNRHNPEMIKRMAPPTTRRARRVRHPAGAYLAALAFRIIALMGSSFSVSISGLPTMTFTSPSWSPFT